MDLLKALYAERRTLSDRVHLIGLYLSNGSKVVTTHPYTQADLDHNIQRLEEAEACIKTINEMRRKNNKNKPKAATAKCGGEKMKKLTKSEALEQGYEMCVADWMGVREDGVIESQLIEDIETEDLEAEEHYLLEKEPYKFVEGEPIYHRTDIILIP